MKRIIATIALTAALVASNINPTTVTIDTTVSEICPHGDLYDVRMDVPEDVESDYDVIVGFYTDDPGYYVGQNISVTINYANDYEIISVNGKELPEYWR